VDLLDGVAANGEVFVFKNAIRSTFHPKIYLFRNDRAAELLVGSGNLTEGGLFTNYEGSLRVSLDLTDATQTSVLTKVEGVLDQWKDETTGLARQLDRKLRWSHLFGQSGGFAKVYSGA